MTTLIHPNNVFDGHLFAKSEFYSTIPQEHSWQKRPIRILKNPNIYEMRVTNMFGEEDCARAILDMDGNIYMWSLYDEYHANVAQHLGIDKFIGLIIYSDGHIEVTDSTSKEFRESDIPKKMITKNNWIKNQFPDMNISISYFNDSIEGDWSEINDR